MRFVVRRFNDSIYGFFPHPDALVALLPRITESLQYFHFQDLIENVLMADAGTDKEAKPKQWRTYT